MSWEIFLEILVSQFSTFDIATHLTKFRETPKGKSTEGKITRKITFPKILLAL